MTDLHDDYERAYLRRVRAPNPLLQDLARQAADSIVALQASAGRTGELVSLSALSAAAAQFGVPMDYILDELERRVREANNGHR